VAENTGRTMRNVFTVGSFTALSRVAGLVREMLQSRLIGAGVAQSAFTLAFALPNTTRRIFGEGALTAAFVPVFKKEVESGAVESAKRLARAVMTTVMLSLLALCAVAAGSLGLWRALASLGPRAELTVSLVTTLLPYMLFICGAAFGMGVLNSLGRFKATASMPLLLNAVWIAALASLAFFPSMPPESRVKVVAWAILAAGAAQMAFMAWRMSRAGFSPLPSLAGRRDPATRLVWRNLAVATLGAGAVQVNQLLDQLLAQAAAPWAAGVIGYAERLMDLPLGVVAVAFGTVLLPAFAGHFAKGDAEAAKDALASSMSSMMSLMLPAAVGLAILAHETTGAIYGGGRFDAVATVRVSRALRVYAAGLAFFGVQKVMTPWFHAQNDMKTPLRISLRTVALNAVLNVAAVVALPVEWRHVGLALSTTVCSAVGCAMLLAAARRVNGTLGLSRCARPMAKIAAGTAAMAAAIVAARPLAEAAAGTVSAKLGDAARLAVLVAAGAATYGVFAAAAGLSFRRRLRRVG